MSIVFRDFKTIYVSQFWREGVEDIVGEIDSYQEFLNILRDKKYKILTLDELNKLMPPELQIIDEIRPGELFTSNSEIINYSDYFDGIHLPSGKKGFVLEYKYKLINKDFDKNKYNLINYISIDLLKDKNEFLNEKGLNFCLFNFSQENCFKHDLLPELDIDECSNDEFINLNLIHILGNQESVNNYLNNDTFTFNNYEYSTLFEICNKLDYNYQSIKSFNDGFKDLEFSNEYLLCLYKEALNQSGLSEEELNTMIEFGDSKTHKSISKYLYNFYYKNKRFRSLLQASKYYNLDYFEMLKYKQENNLLTEDVLEYFLLERDNNGIQTT